MRRAIPRAYIDVPAGDMAAALARLAANPGKPGHGAAAKFEKAFADFIGAKGAVAFSSARAGIYFGLQAFDLRPGEEVILPAYTFWVDAAMVVMAGLKPVFVDVDPRSANIDLRLLEAAVTPKTKVIFLTHLNGIPAEMEEVRAFAASRGLRVIEDCARACGVRLGGRRLGSLDIGVFSFGFGKNLFTVGGGMVTANEGAFLERLRARQTAFFRPTCWRLLVNTAKGILLRLANDPGLFGLALFPLMRRYKVEEDRRLSFLLEPKDPPYDRPPAGFYVSLSRFQAELGRRFLKRIDGHNRRRQENSKVLREALSGIPGLRTFASATAESVEMLYFAFGCPEPKAMQRFLLRRGIDAEDESAADLTRSDLFRKYAEGGRFPEAEALDGKVVLLPCHPRLRPNDIRRMIDEVIEGLRAGPPSPLKP